MKLKLKSVLAASFVLLAVPFHGFSISTKARMVMTGTFAEVTKETGKRPVYDYFTLSKKPQKDDDGIVIEVSGDSFGGRLGLWYDVDAKTGDVGSSISFRRTNLWVRPIPQLKLVLGYNGNDQLYKERIDDWKVGNPFKIDERNWTLHPGYVNCSDVDDMGFGVEVKPLDGWIVTAALARRAGTPGAFGKAFWTIEDGESDFDAWGITSRYYWKDLCFQASFRDNGSKQWKVARAAVGYEANGIYAFFQPCLGIDWNGVDEKYEPTGICFDLYGEYKLGSWGFIGHVPVTVRFSKDTENDPSYLEYDFVVKYNFGTIGNMGDFTPNLRIGSLTQDGDNKNAPYRLSKAFADSFNLDITPGLSMNVGGCKFDVGFEMLINSKLTQDFKDTELFTWKVPFKAELRF